MPPGMAMHALLATGHGKQPTTKKQPVPPVMAQPGQDPRAAALMTLFKAQQAPPPAPLAPATPVKKKPVPQHPTDSNAGL